jgi:hypothetical protein
MRAKSSGSGHPGVDCSIAESAANWNCASSMPGQINLENMGTSKNSFPDGIECSESSIRQNGA